MLGAQTLSWECTCCAIFFLGTFHDFGYLLSSFRPPLKDISENAVFVEGTIGTTDICQGQLGEYGRNDQGLLDGKTLSGRGEPSREGLCTMSNKKKNQRGTDDFYWSGMWLYYIFLCLWSGIDNSGNCTPWNASCLKLFPAALQPIHETRGLSPQVTVGCWRRCPVSPCTTNSLSRWCRPTKAWPSLMLASSISGWVIYWVERPHKVLLCLSSVKPRMRHSSLRAAPTSGQLRLESYLQLPMLHYSHNQKHK